MSLHINSFMTFFLYYFLVKGHVDKKTKQDRKHIQRKKKWEYYYFEVNEAK